MNNSKKHSDFHSDHKSSTPEYHKDYRLHIKNCHPEIYQHNKMVANSQSRASFLQRKYGISDEDFQEILESQQGKCAICGTTIFNGKDTKPNIDHDHKTGKIRGLLCFSCNIALGCFGEDKEVLRSALEYLEGI